MLDKAVAVLKEFPDLRLEIQGHTDDQPLKAKGGKFADNEALSQARAESGEGVLRQEGHRREPPHREGLRRQRAVEDPKGLKGAKLNAARAKNRRVEFKLVSSLTAGPTRRRLQRAGSGSGPAPAPPGSAKEKSSRALRA